MGKPPWLFYYIGNYKNFFVGPILGILGTLGIFSFGGQESRRIQETRFPKRGEKDYNYNLTKKEEELCNRKLGLDATCR
jgi:hypothetical protein